YIIAQNNIEKVIKIIRHTTDGTEKEKLMEHFKLDEIQAQAILDMQLRRLSGLNREKILAEHADLTKACAEYRAILADDNKKKSIIETELLEIKNKYNDPRKSEICLSQDISIENEDLIPREDVVITITTNGYAKRMKQDAYKAQSRGGVGMSGIKTHENDDVEFIIPTCTHNYLLFFTNKGRVYAIKGYFIPEASRTAKGLPLVNILTFQEDEKLAAITAVPNLEDDNSYLFFATKKGIVKRTKLSQFKNIRTNGIIAINLQDKDELLQVSLTDGNRDIILGSSSGKAIHFKESEVRPIGRSAAGVKGIALAKKDYLVGMAIVTEEKNEVLIVTEKGYGKRSSAEEYRVQGRGGMGVKAFNVTAKNGKLVALRSVNPDLDLIITTDKGVIIRMHIDKISLAGRNTQGVILIKLKDDQSIANTAIVDRQIDEDEPTPENSTSTETVEKNETSPIVEE
ncbi:MAG: DNA gyrase subunit A, partial [Anaeroplasmataceae bacterium]|nr:DNA gyrase subunit A [Anaeroplasmataceae bacterium]